MINQTCHDKVKCQIMMSDVKSFMNLNYANQSVVGNCSAPAAAFFIQAPCLFHNDEVEKRKVQGLTIASMGVFIALFFVVYVDYLRATFKNLNIEWDVKTITAGDYSVEVEITDKMWKKYDEDPAFDKDSHKSKLAQFRDFL